MLNRIVTAELRTLLFCFSNPDLREILLLEDSNRRLGSKKFGSRATKSVPEVEKIFSPKCRSGKGRRSFRSEFFVGLAFNLCSIEL